MKDKTIALFSGSRIWVGAGAIHNKSLEGVKNVLKNEDIEGIIFGSITMDEKDGNPGTTFYQGSCYTINSIGLKNLGARNYTQGALDDVVSYVHEKGKKIIVSVAGDSPEDYKRLSEIVYLSGADGVELNLGCPNKWGEGGSQKEIPSFNTKLTAAILQKIVYDGHFTVVGVKLSPYSNPIDLGKIAEVINDFHEKYEFVDYVATCNTFPNAYSESERWVSAITPHPGNPGGYGGLAGPALFPIAFGQVKQLRSKLHKTIAIMGVGGVHNGETMDALLRNGANAVQIVSAYYNSEDPYIFTKILSEYADLPPE